MGSRMKCDLRRNCTVSNNIHSSYFNLESDLTPSLYVMTSQRTPARPSIGILVVSCHLHHS